MVRVRAGVVLVLVLATRAAAEPVPARTAVPLPVPAQTVADTLGMPTVERSRLLLNTVRILFDPSDSPGAVSESLRARFAVVIRPPRPGAFETVPLPLTPRLWRSTIFDVPVDEKNVIAEITTNRSAALLYYGLAALDDETLRWIGEHKDVLVHLTKHPGAVAAFGRSLRIAGGRVSVPGGPAMEPLWKSIVGADPGQPAAFVRGLFRNDRARLAFFYDTVAHLDDAHRRLALDGSGAGGERRVRALIDVFNSFGRDWDAEARPFSKPQFDPVLLLENVDVTPRGALIGPLDEALWTRVYRDDVAIETPFREFEPWKAQEASRIDVAWLAAQLHLTPYVVGRRRLDTFLFAQRVLRDDRADPHVIASVLRGFMAMPALMLTLERMGVADAPSLLAAARQAHAINSIGNSSTREVVLLLFQSALGYLERGVHSRSLSAGQARMLVSSLVGIRIEGGSSYDERIAEWLRTSLFRAAPQPPLEATDPIELATLSLIAGTRSGRPAPLIEWEGHRYRVDPAAAELKRLQRIREQQGTPTLDEAIAQLRSRAGADARQRAARVFAGAVASVLYAAHIGDPEGPALAADNVALTHDFGAGGFRPGPQAMSAWRLPNEIFSRPGWHVQGSLLGLDIALRRLALRRLDSAQLPPGPRLPLLERQTAILTLTFINPHALTDEGRDRIATALSRGRQRVDALMRDAAPIDRVAEDAGMSEWRREMLRWALSNARDEVAGQFNPIELFWLGAPSAAEEDRQWGAAALPFNGCPCLKMPRRAAWENFAGRPSAGLLATRAVDATLRVAEVFAELKVPAAAAPAALAYALQDVLDETEAAYFEDWQGFGRAAMALSRERIVDYIAALTAGGPLVPVVESS